MRLDFSCYLRNVHIVFSVLVCTYMHVCIYICDIFLLLLLLKGFIALWCWNGRGPMRPTKQTVYCPIVCLHIILYSIRVLSLDQRHHHQLQHQQHQQHQQQQQEQNIPIYNRISVIISFSFFLSENAEMEYGDWRFARLFFSRVVELYCSEYIPIYCTSTMVLLIKLFSFPVGRCRSIAFLTLI